MKWIDRQDSLEAALRSMAGLQEIAVDTEADSLHSYFDKVCLIQISANGEDLIVDPLARVDLATFGRLLEDPSISKIFHGGDYDLRIMNRDFGFTVRNLVDTSICAQLLGYQAIGLAALMERHFGVKRLERRPSEYLKEHAYWGFFDDPIGLRLRHDVGVDRIIWGSDFPHVVSPWPHSHEVIENQLAGAPEEEKRRITGQNLLDFLHLA